MGFLVAHQTVVTVVGFWLFSAACSSMPPLPEKAGFGLTWAHNFLQTAAANINKLQQFRKGDQ